MSKLKFRVWMKDEKRYHLPNEDSNRAITLDGHYQLLLIGAGNSKVFRYREKSDNIVIEQYTGLKDNKRTKEFPDGQEIYEGDILIINVGFSPERRAVVIWNDMLATFGLDDDKLFDWLRYSHMIQVIGNIHKNPELLEAHNE